MIRYLKVLGFAMIVVLAFSAMMAASASAQTQGKLTFENGVEGTLDGTEIGVGENYFEDPSLGEKFQCLGSTLVGHKKTIESGTSAEEKAGTKPHSGLIPAGATVATLTASFTNCQTATHKMTFTMNGCDFDWTIGNTTTDGSGEYGLTDDIVCPTGKKIEIHVYFSKENENISICTYTIGPQSITGFDLKNVAGTKNDLVATGTTTTMKVERHGLCGEKTELFNFTQKINLTIKGTDALGNNVGITVSD